MTPIMALNIPHTSKKRIVVVGGGFAGLAVIRALRRTRCQVVLIDKHNYHMFKPLLYQVASSQLNVGDIAFPFRKIFNGWKDFYFRMAYIESVDPTRKILRTTAGEVEYDYLILATGCVPNFFGIDAVKREALAMSNITDALNIRKGPGTNYGTNGTIKDKGVYTIVAESDGPGASKWGKLKSGAGWISLDYTQRL